MPNIIELIAGSGIKINADKDSGKITLSSESNNINSSEGALTKAFIDLIRLSTDGIIIDKSSTYKVPFTGKYEIRLCGGGAAGNCPTAISWGAGGNSGYLETLEIQLTKDMDINITIGAGGIGAKYNESWPNNGRGGDTIITIDSQQYTAKGGKPNIISSGGPGNLSSNLALIDIPFDGKRGSAYASGLLSSANSYTVASNGAMIGGSTGVMECDASGNVITFPGGYSTNGCGGGGGVIAGYIKAGKGLSATPAIGYGAGGGGGVHSGGPNQVVAGGNGAQGAVQIKYLGE